MMKTLINAKIYLILALLIIGYYAYAALQGIAYWDSDQVTRNTEYNNGTRVRGGHSFYHK